jgi:hypothetical protein
VPGCRLGAAHRGTLYVPRHLGTSSLHVHLQSTSDRARVPGGGARTRAWRHGGMVVGADMSGVTRPTRWPRGCVQPAAGVWRLAAECHAHPHASPIGVEVHGERGASV